MRLFPFLFYIVDVNALLRYSCCERTQIFLRVYFPGNNATVICSALKVKSIALCIRHSCISPCDLSIKITDNKICSLMMIQKMSSSRCADPIFMSFFR